MHPVWAAARVKSWVCYQLARNANHFQAARCYQFKAHPLCFPNPTQKGSSLPESIWEFIPFLQAILVVIKKIERVFATPPDRKRVKSTLSASQTQRERVLA